MRLSHTLFSSFLLLPTLALSASLSILIPASPQVPNPSNLPPTTTATLTSLSETHSTQLNTANAFHFRNISAGSYLLSIACATHAFAPLRVDVSADGGAQAWRTFRGHDWANKGEEVLAAEGNRFEVKALGAKDYFMPRQGFSPLSILKSPMILIAGVGAVVVFGMPYLLDNLDDETKAEMEAARVDSPFSAMLGGKPSGSAANFDAAAWLAGTGKSGEGSREGSKEGSKEKGVSR